MFSRCLVSLCPSLSSGESGRTLKQGCGRRQAGPYPPITLSSMNDRRQGSSAELLGMSKRGKKQGEDNSQPRRALDLGLKIRPGIQDRVVETRDLGNTHIRDSMNFVKMTITDSSKSPFSETPDMLTQEIHLLEVLSTCSRDSKCRRRYTRPRTSNRKQSCARRHAGPPPPISPLSFTPKR